MQCKNIAACVCACLLVTFVSAQESEMTVEQAYLSSVEDIIVKELVATEGRDNKLVALQYIESAIDAGRNSADMHASLDILAGEGTFSQSRTEGRLSNNYPDIRQKACELLGRLGTPEAKDTLVKVTLADNEPMVVSAAIRSLADIGLNEEDDVISTIAWTARRFDILNPTSSLALEILNAYEKLAPTVKNSQEMINSIANIATNYAYVTPVRNRAYEVLRNVTGQAQNQQQ